MRAYLEGVRERTARTPIDLYDTFCAKLYTMKKACTWHYLPSDFSKWQTVYYCWVLWTKQNDPTEMTLLTRV
ncbi:transposase [Lacticaseibacillus paracasei]|uniref:transposase n=1 Tax=Lacticaseibacillus paracasei TaxID=1597 RepID=UPI0034E4CE3E